MVTYEEARQFREAHDQPLTWDDDIPAPPHDPIEFTRLILQAAEDVGFGTPDWQANVPDGEEAEEQFKAFQAIMARHVYQQRFRGVPRIHYDHGEFGNGTLIISWNIYLLFLEKDFYETWKTAWQYGVSENREVLLFDCINKCVAEIRENYVAEQTSLWKALTYETWFVAWPDPESERFTNRKSQSAVRCITPLPVLKYQDLSNLEVNDVIARRIHASDGRKLEITVRDHTGIKFCLTEIRWCSEVSPILGLIAILLLFGSVAGAFRGLFPGWWLIFIIPVVLILLFFAGTQGHDCRNFWIDPTLTFEGLIKKIVETKRREWAAIQEFYDRKPGEQSE